MLSKMQVLPIKKQMKTMLTSVRALAKIHYNIRGWVLQGLCWIGDVSDLFPSTGLKTEAMSFLTTLGYHEDD